MDTGATYLSVASSVLRRLGVQPQRQNAFELADGRIVRYDVGEVTVRLQGHEGSTWCIFADENTAPLIGVYMLEGLLLGVDPVAHQLIPVTGQLTYVGNRGYL